MPRRNETPAEEALRRATWRPISKAHEDYGPLILIDMADPGNYDVAHVCDLDWNEKAKGMTHFAQFPALTQEMVEVLNANQ